jgi:two-component SAPR family response regulator
MPKKWCFFLVLSGLCLSCYGNNLHYGLTFRSHTFNQDERTSLDLTSGHSLPLSPGSSIDFDLKLDSAFLTYGYVFRLILDDVSSLDLITNFNTKKLNFVLVETQNVLFNIEFHHQIEIKKDNWMKINVQLHSDSIYCNIDGVSQAIPHSFADFKRIRMYFGKNGHSVFHTTDVPPITIRNLVIRNRKGEAVRKWKMQRHNKNEVYDEIKNSRAKVENGIWEIDKHLKWNKIQSITLKEKNAQIAYDSVQARIFIATRDSLLIYNASNHVLVGEAIQAGAPFMYGGSYILFDEKNDRLLSYSIMHPDFVVYDLDKKEWSDKLTEYLPPIQHHNRFIDAETNQLIVFGGYGNHQYKADMLRHDLDSGVWKSDDLSADIACRYLSAMGYLGNGELLIMGGYGNHSGKQENLPRNLYDIYKVNFKNRKIELLSTLSGIKNPIVFSNSMIIEKNEQKLYALAYDNGKHKSFLSLVSVNWNTSELKVLGDSIPYRFLDTESFCDLFLYRKTSTLYAIVLHKKENSEQYNVEIYSLAYPPLSMSDVFQTPDYKGVDNTIYLLAIIGFLLLLFATAVYYRKRKEKEPFIRMIEDPVEPNDKKFIKPCKRNSTILLFGGFQVFDREGNDITDHFTPILKQIFLFLLLNSIKDGKKVTSEKLDETFWQGMDKVSASNNKSVNISKLRILLDKIGDVTVSNKNSYWCIHLGEAIVCDYQEVITLLKQIDSKLTLIDKAVVRQILKFASGGLLLPQLNIEWVDDYKSEYTDLITNVLMTATTIPEIKDDTRLLLQIANVILLHDHIDEEAIKIKCRALFHSGQKGTSKQCFDKFQSEYIRILGESPKFNYEDLFSGSKK